MYNKIIKNFIVFIYNQAIYWPLLPILIPPILPLLISFCSSLTCDFKKSRLVSHSIAMTASFIMKLTNVQKMTKLCRPLCQSFISSESQCGTQ